MPKKILKWILVASIVFWVSFFLAHWIYASFHIPGIPAEEFAHLSRRAVILYFLAAFSCLLLTQRNGILILTNIGVALVLFEFILLFLLSYPRILAHGPGHLLQHIQHLYFHYERKMIQILPECSQYDSDLGYRLRPPGCAFSNREYSTPLRVNSSGLRDDEASLRAPEIIVLGDSVAMGWGVQQEESFPEKLEKKLGVTVLNAAVPSYGTARELRLLKLLDLSKLRYLILQYHANDADENEDFLKRSDSWKVLSQADYEKMIRHHLAATRYYFLLYTNVTIQDLLKGVVQRSAKASAAERNSEKEARTFLDTIKASKILDGASFKILVVPIQNWGADPVFSGALSRLLEQDLEMAQKVEVMDLSSKLTAREHFFILDDHMNAAGHAVTAEVIAGKMEPAMKGDYAANS